MKKKSHIKEIFCGIFLILFLSFGIYSIANDALLYFTGIKTDAVVTQVAYERRGSSVTNFYFVDNIGHPHSVNHVQIGFLHSVFINGNHYTIVYDPYNPDNIVVDGAFLVVQFIFCSLLLVFVCLILFTTWKLNQKTRV